MKQVKSTFKRTKNWNKYHPKFITFPQNILNYLIEQSFQLVNRLFLLPFENEADKEVHAKHYLTTEEIKDYNVIIDGKKLFYQRIKNDFKRSDNIRKIATGQGDDNINGCLVDYNNLKKH